MSKKKAFDPAAYLDSEEAIAEYLAEAKASGDPAEIRDSEEVVRRAREKTFNSPHKPVVSQFEFRWR